MGIENPNKNLESGGPKSDLATEELVVPNEEQLISQIDSAPDPQQALEFIATDTETIPTDLSGSTVQTASPEYSGVTQTPDMSNMSPGAVLERLAGEVPKEVVRPQVSDATLQQVMKLAGLQGMDPNDIDAEWYEELTAKVNPNNFVAETPPASDEELLSWLEWRNKEGFDYHPKNLDITPEMTAKAVKAFRELSPELPITELSPVLILSYADMSPEEVAQRKAANEAKKTGKIETDEQVVAEPGVLNNQEIDEMMKEVGTEYGKLKSESEDANSGFMVLDLFLNTRNLPPEIGHRFDAHGLDMGKDLVALNNLLSNGVSPNKPFHTMNLSGNEEDGIALGAQGVYATGGFIVLGHPDKQIADGGIAGVLVNAQYYPIIDELAAKFPNVRFIKAADMQGNLQQWLTEGSK